MNVISLDSSLVRGSHGRLTESPDEGPVFITSDPERMPAGSEVDARAVKEIVLSHVFGG